MPSHRYDLEGIGSNVEFGKTGPRIKDSSGVVELRNNADDSYAVTRGADPVGDDDLVTKRYMETVCSVRVVGQIDGGSPPSPGIAGRVFIVTTAGGTYNLKELYRDSGTAWDELTVFDGMRITITEDLTGGTDEYEGDSVYVWDDTGGEWVLVGPSPELAKAVRSERKTLTYADTGDNNVGDPLPTDAVVLGVSVSVTQVFDGSSPELKVGDSTDDDRHMQVKDNKLTKVGIYSTDQLYLYGADTQIIANLTIGGSPTQGQCMILILYAVA